MSKELNVDIEKYIRDIALPKLYGQKFMQKSLLLQSGGQYKFDNVSEDESIVAVISTAAGRTAEGKQATDNLQKLRQNVYWATMIEHNPKIILVLTEQSMVNLVKEEKKKDRFPKDIEIVKVKLPD